MRLKKTLGWGADKLLSVLGMAFCRRCCWLLVWLGGVGGTPILLAAEGPLLRPLWPTPSTGFAERRPISEYLQPTAGGDPLSACFGCVRSGGSRFHEGIDIAPVQRNRQGEPLDDVYAIFGGVVVHLSKSAGASSYGRYVVLEHSAASPGVYSLYAHLAEIDPGLQVGKAVGIGERLGRMGYTAGGYSIPRQRAHLHLEIGFRLSDRFQSWYDRQGFGSRNEHGLWNGMNLVAFDSLDFYEQCRRQDLHGIAQYLQTLSPAVVVRVVTSRKPDLLRRAPELLDGAGKATGWDVTLTGWGLPLRFRPVSAAAMAGTSFPHPRRGSISAAVLSVDEKAWAPWRCRKIVQIGKDGWQMGEGGQQIIDLLFWNQ